MWKLCPTSKDLADGPALCAESDGCSHPKYSSTFGKTSMRQLTVPKVNVLKIRDKISLRSLEHLSSIIDIRDVFSEAAKGPCQLVRDSLQAGGGQRKGTVITFIF
jgi:hypothetical protein